MKPKLANSASGISVVIGSLSSHRFNSIPSFLAVADAIMRLDEVQ
jgi:hypothetical protein